MFSITEQAKAQLAKMLAKSATVPGDTFRLQPTGSFLSLVVDDVEADDVIFGHEGRTVLVLDEGTYKLLSKSRLDLIRKTAGERLGLTPIDQAIVPTTRPDKGPPRA